MSTDLFALKTQKLLTGGSQCWIENRNTQKAYKIPMHCFIPDN